MSRDPKIRILIADDHFIVRSGLVALLGTEPDLEVVGQAENGQQVFELFEKLHPDLVLMDLRMPGVSGDEAIVRIREIAPSARVIVLTAYSGDEDIHKALNSGAQGYLLKSSTGDGLLPAIRAVLAGKTWVPKDVATQLAMRNAFDELTPREVGVLEQLYKGLANKQIADALGVSEHTVKFHLKNILVKLHVADRTEAVTAAIKRGILRV
jgi:DNA-binding NarL/FixJ family response regulator